LNSSLPLDLTFVDEQSHAGPLRQYFTGKKPVVLQMGYFQCPMLCTLTSRGLAESLKQVTLNAGSDFDVVFVSIDPKETPALAAAKKESFIKEYGRSETETGWHFLTGKEEQIKKLADAVGFQYRWIPSAQQFAHPAVLMVCTPDGRVSRYLYGVKFDPRTVRLSLVEASDGKVGSTVDRFILTCFSYDGHLGKYAFFAINLMKAGGAVMIVLLAGFMFWLARHGPRGNAT
jgi:protein SCO1/2